jgi:hypothetical protein
MVADQAWKQNPVSIVTPNPESFHNSRGMIGCFAYCEIMHQRFSYRQSKGIGFTLASTNMNAGTSKTEMINGAMTIACKWRKSFPCACGQPSESYRLPSMNFRAGKRKHCEDTGPMAKESESAASNIPATYEVIKNVPRTSTSSFLSGTRS